VLVREAPLSRGTFRFLRHLCLPSALLASALVASAQQNPATKPQETYRDQIVAEVEHEPITLHELELAARLTTEYRELKDNQPGNIAAIRQSLKKQLELLLDEKILVIECTKDKITLSKDDEKRIDREVERYAEPHGGLEGLKALLAKIGVPYEYFVERRKTNLLIAKLLLKNVSRDIYVEPEKIRKYYDEHKREKFRRDAVTKFYQVDIYANLAAARIPEDVKPLKDRWNAEEAQRYAERVREKLAKSPSEWRSIAGASTMDQSAIDRSGLVQVPGVTPMADSMAGDLGKAIDALKPGEVSPVVRSAFGYHVFCLKERSAVDVLPFSEVQHQIQETLRQEIWQERLKAWIARVKDEHPVRTYLPIQEER
jgi:peptidyl-prolyl cis-trans isomerase SurA